MVFPALRYAGDARLTHTLLRLSPATPLLIQLDEEQLTIVKSLTDLYQYCTSRRLSSPIPPFFPPRPLISIYSFPIHHAPHSHNLPFTHTHTHTSTDDVEKVGNLSKEQFEALYKHCADNGYALAEFGSCMEQVDKSGDGLINFKYVTHRR